MNTIISILFLTLSLSVSAADLQWKSILVSGDDSIANFDNGRKVLSEIFADFGASEENQTHLTSASVETRSDVALATFANLERAFNGLAINKKTDGCLVFMTSHGAKYQGFYMSRSGILSPTKFNQMVKSACGEAPTVVLISACYSGQFINADLAEKNRIILTAARNDRPSFGCSTETTYTFWDHCLIDNLPVSDTWQELYANVKQCISEKESALGFQPSHPQAFFGDSVKNLRILNK
jgi:hypothetical protein